MITLVAGMWQYLSWALNVIQSWNVQMSNMWAADSLLHPLTQDRKLSLPSARWCSGHGKPLPLPSSHALAGLWASWGFGHASTEVILIWCPGIFFSFLLVRFTSSFSSRPFPPQKTFLSFLHQFLSQVCLYTFLWYFTPIQSSPCVLSHRPDFT